MKLLSASYQELKDPFHLFDSIDCVISPNQITKDTALILWGGEDIGTDLYDEKPNRTCWAAKPSKRDSFELALIKAAVAVNAPIIGVCRGAQLLCVAAGGKLAQHIDGHGRSHLVTLHDEDDTVIECNSSHHQMMLPPKSAKILATSGKTTGLNQHNEAVVHEVVNEVVLFPLLRGIGIQPHPEWSNCPVEFVDYCRRKIKEHLL